MMKRLPLVLSIILLIPPLSVQASDVSTTIWFFGDKRAELNSCSDVWDTYEDAYTSVSINTKPEIEAPSTGLQITVRFDQDCPGLDTRYLRTLELVKPSGERLKLVRDTNLSRISKFRSIYCFSFNCVSFTDVYQLSVGSDAPEGSYGLIFTTDFSRTVCTSVNASTVCESNVPTKREFEAARFFTIKQSEASQSASPIVEAPETFETVQKTLPQFTGTSSKLSKSQKSYLSKLLRENPTGVSLTCTGTVFLTQTKVFESLQLSRARAACAYARSINLNLLTTFKTQVVRNFNSSGKTLLTLTKTSN